NAFTIWCRSSMQGLHRSGCFLRPFLSRPKRPHRDVSILPADDPRIVEAVLVLTQRQHEAVCARRTDGFNAMITLVGNDACIHIDLRVVDRAPCPDHTM